jgi:hypothetical protein
VLVALISTVWIAALFFGVTMCHLAGRSDDSHGAALAEWISIASATESDQNPSARASEHTRTSRRATG